MIVLVHCSYLWRHGGLIVSLLHVDLYQEVSVGAVLGIIVFGSWARHSASLHLGV